ncbi:hypothetical protein CUMW_115300 [Citrus unshiu]|nr:hypothetical protein CUMW_115300 [Citrus unshiu]
MWSMVIIDLAAPARITRQAITAKLSHGHVIRRALSTSAAATATATTDAKPITPSADRAKWNDRGRRQIIPLGQWVPKVAVGAYVAPNVTVCDGASVWPGSVLRGDLRRLPLVSAPICKRMRTSRRRQIYVRMEKKLVTLFGAAKKAADAAAATNRSEPEVQRCADALKHLQGFPVTYDLLVSTQVGKSLRHLKKHPCEKVQNAASELLHIWKQKIVLGKETSGNKRNGSKLSVDEKFQKQTSDSNAVKSGRSTAKEKKATASIRKPSHADQAKDSMRDKIRKDLEKALSRVASEAADDEEITDRVKARDPKQVAASVERVMFEKLRPMGVAEKRKHRSIMFNMSDEKNPDLRRRVLIGEVTPERLVTMTPEELASDDRRQQNEEIKAKFMFKCEVPEKKKGTTDQFKCSGCGKSNCIYDTKIDGEFHIIDMRCQTLCLVMVFKPEAPQMSYT